MLLRRAAVADSSTLADAWYAMLAEDELVRPDARPDWRSLLTAEFHRGIETGSQVWFVIAADDRIVATGGAFVRRDPIFTALLGVQATIGGVYTEPAFRRRGCARRIVRALLEYGRGDGWDNVRLRASRQGRPLYEGFGFVPGDEMVPSWDAYASVAPDTPLETP